MTSKELKLNETYFGFKFISKEYVEEIKSTALIFEHLKTKAKILKLQNNETENSFSISFKTPSTDSTGMQHIMEHSVLNGSKKYPLRDPFATLAKSTINSFLNAFTWKDKTAYAFSSSNKKDFFKLLDVYLDAVFNPKAIENKKIFLQEGWRYTLDENNKLKYDGIVYNEMKGVYSSVNNLIEEYTLSNLFPETEYSFDSGGNPKEIPNLTYESFIAYYKKHYHPTNSKVYFYGNNDILEELKFLEENFFFKLFLF
ncbi:MAG: insulinase family protein [Nanoarchaeota archaeon]